MTDERRLELDMMKLESAEKAVELARAELDKTRGDATWGPIVGELADALKVLRRRLLDEDQAIQVAQAHAEIRAGTLP